MSITSTFKRSYSLRSRQKGNFIFLLLTVLLIIPGRSLIAQTGISPLWPERGITLSVNLWNISLLNSQPSFSAIVELSVSDAASGTPLYTGTSGQFLMASGANVLSVQKVQPVTYGPVSGMYIFNPAAGSLLPPGIFNVCYRILKNEGELPQLQGEGCFVLENDPLTPPSLVTPADNDSLTTGRPFFTWLPPTPYNSFTNLNYSIRVVEKTQNQSPQEAIERNLPSFSQQGITYNSTNYPMGMPQLDTGKCYAWQVLAYNGINYVGASECWIFSLKTDPVELHVEAEGAYIPLIKEESTQLVAVKNHFRFTYNNEASDTLLTYFIKPQLSADDSTSDIRIQLYTLSGINYFTIDLNTTTGLKKEVVYELLIRNDRNERWRATFKWVE